MKYAKIRRFFFDFRCILRNKHICGNIFPLLQALASSAITYYDTVSLCALHVPFRMNTLKRNFDQPVAKLLKKFFRILI